MIKVDKLFSFFLSRCFRKEIDNMSSVLSSYRNTLESLGELENVRAGERISPDLNIIFQGCLVQMF